MRFAVRRCGKAALAIGAAFAALATLAGAADAAAARLDCSKDPTLIVPGRCAGPVTAHTTYRSLKRGLPGHSVTIDVSPDEDGWHCISTIDKGQPNELRIHWTTESEFDDRPTSQYEDENRKACAGADFGGGVPERVEIGRFDTAHRGGLDVPVAVPASWHTQEGVRLGMDLHALQQVWPSKLVVSGWATENSGRIIFADKLTGYMEYDPKREKLLNKPQLDSVSTDGDISADDPVLGLLRPFLTVLVVDLNLAKPLFPQQ